MKQKFPLERLFRALADPTRLRLINLVAKQEVCVCYFVEVIGVPQPKISRHLAYLRRAGIVAARREGKWMHYKLVVPSDLHAGCHTPRYRGRASGRQGTTAGFSAAEQSLLRTE